VDGKRNIGPWLGLDKAWLWLARKLLSVWVRTTVQPADLETLELDPNLPVCYALERRSLAAFLVLQEETKRAGLPRPTGGLHLGSLNESRSILWARYEPRKRSRSKHGTRAERLLGAIHRHDLEDIQILPAAVFWGRSPQRQQGLFGILFSDSWSPVGRLRRSLAVLIHGRNTFLRFSDPIRLSQIASEELEPVIGAHKLNRILRVHFNRVRTAVVGPDLSHRRTLIAGLMASPEIRAGVREEAKRSGKRIEAVTGRARGFLDEIASDYSYAVIRLLDKALSRLWHRIYNGIDVFHLETLRPLAAGGGIVYLPCHRSHFDYLLLSYILHANGLVPPHVAAGVNLNIPGISGILRSGGAFFIRRSFRGQALYSTVFNRYLQEMIKRGFPLEFFVEGGRSRTGRLLQPRPGMLGMTVTGFARAPTRPLFLVPIHIGYERIFEAGSYISELSGQPKKSESLWGLVGAIRALRGNFGRVQVSVGEPIPLAEFLDEHAPGWGQEAGEAHHRPEWLEPVVTRLGRRVMAEINAAAHVNPINLLAISLLASPRHALSEADLVKQIELYQSTLRLTRYSNRITVSTLSGRDIVAYGETLKVLVRESHELGDILRLDSRQSILMSYFRNSVLHLFALPSFVAVCFLNNRRLHRERIVKLGTMVYPFVRAELFLHWRQSDLPAAMNDAMDALVELGLLQTDPDSGELLSVGSQNRPSLQLSYLAEAVLQTFERFYITGAILVRCGPGQLKQDQLERLCHLTAQRLSMLYGFNSPEFFDQTLFRNFIAMLRKAGVLWSDTNECLTFDESVSLLYDDAKLILSHHIRHSIDELAQVDTTAPTQLVSSAGTEVG
jgi:glycerol-3-phosphate O-acyltransferase